MNSGAECSTARNPLAQFTKHAGEDRSLQYDRMNQRPGAAGPMSMRSDARVMSQEDKQMMDRFSQQGRMGPGPGPAGPFAYDQMRQEINGIQNPQKPGAPGWVDDFRSTSASPIPQQQQHRESPATAGAAPQGNRWAGEFRQSPAGPAAAVAGNANASHMAMGGGARFSSMPYTPMFSSMGPQMANQAMVNQTQSAQIVELDHDKWEEQFNQIELNSKDKGKEKLTKEQQQQNEESTMEPEQEDPLLSELNDDHFENIWDRIKSQVLDNVEDWSKSAEDGPAWDRDFDEYTTSRPDFGDYEFEEGNPYVAQDDPFAMGVELMDNGAKLSVAALCFEAAVKKNPDHVEAWARLGACQAQNEKEDPAIRALERAIKLDPSNLNALLNLSVSYTNEGYENAAYATLERWLATKYPDIAQKARQQEPKLENEDRFQLHSRVTELFIRAAQMSPDGASIDADVQVGLGVLFYGNEEYEKAIDCFNTALSVRPNDPLLWNRLGATLANSNRSEEAIDAYYRALELRPSFVRARYNLGVSCINIGCYKEAAQHLLSALSLHKTDSADDDVLANQSTNLYETLRRVFLAMERRDLVEKVENGMDVNEFRSEFDF
ncbi:Pex5p [Sugiyamaella lignohabitans]|uniref:Peroxisomal targeting signal receptor n=1 Tax=Sugiyamaella lignohabitans TaxID=796027 RepID=A0A167D4Z8_9ASCO|nr:Pex5p [Sugiyamaella lignohabitans]ANB12485.1 Pex5p [Sugiyamaella lignohabitans]